tara:strand:- start:4858 stop:5337 length:480 start_codon:yes stop_codon:yes gene_type:complete
MEKKCRGCGEVKPFEDFYSHKQTKDGKRTKCKECLNAQRKEWQRKNKESSNAKSYEWRKKNPEKWKTIQKRSQDKNRRRWRYGLERERYNAMMEDQDGKCAICNHEADLVVDHDHDTSEVRALLCDHCNRGLGYFRHDPRFLDHAAHYIRTFQDSQLYT